MAFFTQTHVRDVSGGGRTFVSPDIRRDSAKKHLAPQKRSVRP